MEIEIIKTIKLDNKEITTQIKVEFLPGDKRAKKIFKNLLKRIKIITPDR